MPSAHARLAPSSCDRWSTCTASVDLIDKLQSKGVVPADDTSEWAAEGTVAHAIREMCLEFSLDPHHFIGTVMKADGFTFTVDEAMAGHLQPGIDWIREHSGNPDVEIRVNLSPWLPDQFGTCDTGWIERQWFYYHDTDTQVSESQLTISDLKYGQGEPVDATNNKQLRLYALGYWHHLGRPHVDRVLMNIDQPRAGGMKFWEISLTDLVAFGEEMKAVYAKIVGGDVKFQPSAKGCRWCSVRKAPGGCAPRDRWLLEMAADAYEELPNELIPGYERQNLSGARRWQIVQHAPDIRARLAELHEESLQAALNGNPDPGSKAVEGDLGDRKFTDEKKAEALLRHALGEDAYKPRQLIGFTEIDKLVKPGRKKKGHPETWEALQQLVDRPAGKPKLVPVEHAKPALVQHDDVFDDL